MATKKTTKTKQKPEMDEEKKVKKATSKSVSASKSSTKKSISKPKKIVKKASPKAKETVSKSEPVKTEEIKKVETKETEIKDSKKSEKTSPKKKMMIKLSPIFTMAIAAILTFALVAGGFAIWLFTSSEYAYKQFINAYQNEEYDKSVEYIDMDSSIKNYYESYKEVYLKATEGQDEEIINSVKLNLDNATTDEALKQYSANFDQEFKSGGMLKDYPVTWNEIFSESKKFDTGYGYPVITEGETTIYFVFEREGLGWKVKAFEANWEILEKLVKDNYENQAQANLQIEESQETNAETNQ